MYSSSYFRLVIGMAILVLLLGCSDRDKTSMTSSPPVKSPNSAGDINCNGVANEIADAVMFCNYFVSGLAAFGDNFECAISESDVNHNGGALELGDMVYLIRIVVGDALPNPTPPAEPTQISFQNNQVLYDALYDLGAALLVFHFTGDLGTPILGTGLETMDLKYAIDGNDLRVLIYNIGSGYIPAGGNSLVTIACDGEVDLAGVEIADYNGSTVDVMVRNLPASAELAQNYPNPFNGSTTIGLGLPTASTYKLTIGGMGLATGYKRVYEGTADAGFISLKWDGRDTNGNPGPPGFYYYKATINGRETKAKIMLMLE